MEGIENLKKLEILDLSNNEIEKVDRPQSSTVSVSMLSLTQDGHANPKLPPVVFST